MAIHFFGLHRAGLYWFKSLYPVIFWVLNSSKMCAMSNLPSPRNDKVPEKVFFYHFSLQLFVNAAQCTKPNRSVVPFITLQCKTFTLISNTPNPCPGEILQGGYSLKYIAFLYRGNQ